MPHWLKITIGIFTTFLVVFVIAGIIFYQVLIASLPEYNGEKNVNGIKDRVEIYRDSMAIPYIIASNEEDAAYAIGYVHAQDRLFSMDLIRRAAEGRLSEILGSETLPFDKMFRTAGIVRAVNENLKKMSSEDLKILSAYSKGVNQYIKEAKGKYPVEFDALGYDPEEWKPFHSLLVGRMLAWELNISWWIDISFTHLVQKLGEEKVLEIIPQYAENAPVVIPPELKNYPEVDLGFLNTDRDFRKFMRMNGIQIGSNNWVVNKKLSASGKPIIANDTHLAYSAPSRWYAIVVKGGELNSEGFTLPGIPAIVIGKNQNISWTVTNVMADDSDFYIEKIDSTGKRYFFNNEWRNFRIIKEKIKVKDTTDVEFEIKLTHRGPVISDIHPYNFLYPEKNIKPAVISMHWLGNEFSNEFAAFRKINKAKNREEFKSALKDFSVPAQNFVYADKDGNIGYLLGGKLPVRETNSPTFIYDGSTDKYDWKRILNSSELPSILNPESGFIASANNKVISDFKYHISNIWEPSSRYERIVQLLSSKEKHSLNDYKKYQNDFISPYAEKITAHILKAFRNVKVNDKNLILALELLNDWNYEFNEYSQVPAIYAMFFQKLLENIYYDEMGDDLFNEFLFVTNVPYRSIYQMLSDSSNSWFNNINTEKTETKNEIIRKSLSDALTSLEELFGKEIKNWQWGKLHKGKFKHAFSGAVPMLDSFIDIGPFPIGGDGTTLFNTEYSFNEGIEYFSRFDHEPFENDVGPSMRYVFDFAKPDEFYMILTTGQSGNVMSDHYRDMSEMWLRGNYIKVKTDINSIRENKFKMILNPE